MMRRSSAMERISKDSSGGGGGALSLSSSVDAINPTNVQPNLEATPPKQQHTPSPYAAGAPPTITRRTR